MKTEDYPDVESFEITVTESWTNTLDLREQESRTFKSFDELKKIHPLRISDPKARDYHSIDLETIFLRAYRSESGECKTNDNYPTYRQGETDVLRRITAKVIKKKPESD